LLPGRGGNTALPGAKPASLVNFSCATGGVGTWVEGAPQALRKKKADFEFWSLNLKREVELYMTSNNMKILDIVADIAASNLTT